MKQYIVINSFFWGPVIDGTSFSMSNLEMDWFFNDSLCNRGKGTNIGLDITLERFLQSCVQ